MQTLRQIGFFLSLYFSPLLYGEVLLYPNPAQQYNTVSNFANRVIYLFVQVGEDGSVTLQIETPPIYPQDETLVNSGIAVINCKKVLQTYTAKEAAALDLVNISCTVEAMPNIFSADGYSLYASLFQWLVNLDPKSTLYYQLQSQNITLPYSLDALNNVNFNSNNGEFSVYSDILTHNKWVSAADGAFLSPSLTDNAFFSTTTAKAAAAQEFTFQIDFKKLPLSTAGTYSFYMVIQMMPIPSTTTLMDRLTYYSDLQQTQVFYLYNSILAIDAYLNGKNTLYVPLPAQQLILYTNRSFLLDLYDKTLAAMKVQWTAYSALPNLTPDEKSLIGQMLVYIAGAEADQASLSL